MRRVVWRVVWRGCDNKVLSVRRCVARERRERWTADHPACAPDDTAALVAAGATIAASSFFSSQVDHTTRPLAPPYSLYTVLQKAESCNDLTFASSFFSSQTEPKFAVDGDSTTIWHTAETDDARQFTLSLATRRVIDGLVITGAGTSGDYSFQALTIERSIDGEVRVVTSLVSACGLHAAH